MQPDTTTTDAGKAEPKDPTRRPYATPRLTDMGSIRELTQALPVGGSDNNPGFPNGSVM
ncbi:MAG: lasso RiPP family leader peptide-containing protein [Pirellulales bacterium]